MVDTHVLSILKTDHKIYGLASKYFFEYDGGS